MLPPRPVDFVRDLPVALTATECTGEHLRVSSAPANGITIEYETFGDPREPAMLLVCGLGAQLLRWDSRFCEQLAERGLYVIRFDNRDVGLSSWFDDTQVDLMELGTELMAGRPGPPVPYHLSDMAADAVGLLDALGIERAHVVGASMGGMIAQTIAIDYPRRVLSLTSIMSSTGELGIGEGTPEAIMGLLTPPPTERDAYGTHVVKLARLLGTKTLFDEEAVRTRALNEFDRGFHPDGGLRQMAAIMTAPPRAAALSELRVPALVIHGRQDPLIQLPAGERTAVLLAGSRLVILDDAGHDLPRPLWPTIVGAITELTASVQAEALAVHVAAAGTPVERPQRWPRVRRLLRRLRRHRRPSADSSK